MKNILSLRIQWFNIHTAESAAVNIVKKKPQYYVNKVIIENDWEIKWVWVDNKVELLLNCLRI